VDHVELEKIVMPGSRKHLVGRRDVLKNALKLAAAGSAALALPVSVLAQSSGSAPSATWISTTEAAPWKVQSLRPAGWRWDTLNVQIDESSQNSEMAGFGACFNELGWTSLQALSATDREGIFDELFSPTKGANFTICRMPIGANDFSRGWYS